MPLLRILWNSMSWLKVIGETWCCHVDEGRGAGMASSLPKKIDAGIIQNSRVSSLLFSFIAKIFSSSGRVLVG
jgi:hypothetical protein